MKCPVCGQKIENLKNDNEKINISDRFLYNIYVARRKRGEQAKKIIFDLLSKLKISERTLFRKLKRIRDILRKK